VDIHPPRPGWEDEADQPQTLPAPDLKDKLGMIPMEPGSLVMKRKKLQGIRQRAGKFASKQKETADA
jgi:hypothetical protein